MTGWCQTRNTVRRTYTLMLQDETEHAQSWSLRWGGSFGSKPVFCASLSFLCGHYYVRNTEIITSAEMGLWNATQVVINEWVNLVLSIFCVSNRTSEGIFVAGGDIHPVVTSGSGLQFCLVPVGCTPCVLEMANGIPQIHHFRRHCTSGIFFPVFLVPISSSG